MISKAEALACVVNKNRVMELTKKWGCDDVDAKMYAEYIGANIQMDGNSWRATRKDFVNLQKSPAGFGATALEALAELYKELKFKPEEE